MLGIPKKQWIQAGLFLIGLTIASAIARIGGVWIFVGWAVGCLVMFAQSIAEWRERGHAGVIIILALATGLIVGGIDYMFRMF